MVGLQFLLIKTAQSVLGIVFFFSALILATGGLIYICYKKGETARWRWGK
jgi:hypothetical protein